MGRRTLLLISSILIAALGTGLVAIYVRTAEDRAQAGTTQIRVFYAKKDIPAGLSSTQALDQGLIDVKEIRKSDAPKSAVESTAQLQQLKGRTVSPVLSDSLLDTRMFAEAASVPVSGLTKGTSALGLTVEGAARLPALLQAGDTVNIYVTDAAAKQTQPVLMNATVLYIGNGDGTDPKREVVDRNIITVAVPNDRVQDFLTKTASGTIAFARPAPGDAPAAGAVPASNAP